MHRREFIAAGALGAAAAGGAEAQVARGGKTMTLTERLAAVEDIRNLKARYCRAVDTKDAELLRSVFAPDVVADYGEPWKDPVRGNPPQMGPGGRGAPMQGADAVVAGIGKGVADMTTVHHCAVGEIEVESADAARAVWPMVDRLRFDRGGPIKEVTGYGFYRETYVKLDGRWRIKTLELVRLRVDVSTAG